jgi:hypothetical protein
MNPLRLFVAVAVLFVPLAAQAGDKAAQQQDEEALVRAAVEGLHAVADAFQAEKQHLRALELRREIWLEYDETDQKARERTGFVRVGDLWRKDDARLVLDRNLDGNKTKLRRIEKDLDALEQRLLASHRELAESYDRTGDGVRAARHWRRVLRFAPGDAAATAALALRSFEGFAGSPDELRMLRRARAIQGAVEWLNRTPFPAAPLGDRRHGLLEGAGIQHTGVRSASFEVWGSIPIEDLQVIAADCERALLLAHTLFGTALGEPFVPRRRRNLLFVATAEEYASVLQACRGQFDAERLRFLTDEVDQCFVDHQGQSLRLHKAALGLPVARDQAVRGVVQDAFGVQAEGLWEGLGHAACGFLFGRTLTFLLEQQKGRTSAGTTQKTLTPDIDVWMQIAQESAWAKSDTRTSELVLISAANFSVEQRVKAWAICHYLIHWRPELLRQLDDSQSPTIKTAVAVENEFLRRTGVPLPRLDDDWRTYWARGDQLRQAMARDPMPNEKAKDRKSVERARAVIDAVNAARAAARVGPVGWFRSDSPDAALLQRHERDLAAYERERQRFEREKPRGKEPPEPPATPACVGRTALWAPGADAVAAVEAWQRSPALRDLLLHPGRDLLGAIEVQGAALDVSPPAQPATAGAPTPWPSAGQQDVPGAAAWSAVGVVTQKALAAAGVADVDVGMPLTLHFWRAMDSEALSLVRCEVFVGNLPIEGVLVVDAPLGVVAFVPLRPLPPKARLEVRWFAPPTILPPGTTVAPLVCDVR